MKDQKNYTVDIWKDNNCERLGRLRAKCHLCAIDSVLKTRPGLELEDAVLQVNMVGGDGVIDFIVTPEGDAEVLYIYNHKRPETTCFQCNRVIPSCEDWLSRREGD